MSKASTSSLHKPKRQWIQKRHQHSDSRAWTLQAPAKASECTHLQHGTSSLHTTYTHTTHIHTTHTTLHTHYTHNTTHIPHAHTPYITLYTHTTQYTLTHTYTPPPLIQHMHTHHISHHTHIPHNTHILSLSLISSHLIPPHYSGNWFSASVTMASENCNPWTHYLLNSLGNQCKNG